MLPVCVFVHLMGLHWAAPSLLHWPAFPHQPAYSSNKAIIQMLIQTCTTRQGEDKSAAALFLKLDQHQTVSLQSTPTRAGLLLQDVKPRFQQSDQPVALYR